MNRLTLVLRFPLLSCLTIAPAGAVLAQPATTRPAATAPATQPDEAAAIREMIEQEMTGLAPVQADSIRDVVRLTVDDAGHLQLRTGVDAAKGRRRLHVVDLPGPSTLVVVGEGEGERDADGFYEPRVFQYQHHEISEPGGALTITQVMLGPTSLLVTRGTESDGTVRNIELVQTGLYLQEADERVRLYVHEFDGARETKFTLGAPTFADLRKQHPAEFEQYLGPVLRDLKQSDALLVVDPRTAWQVLAHRYETPADVASQVHELVRELDADDPQIRMRAADALEEMGLPAAMALMKLDRADLSAEQRNQIDNVLSAYTPLPIDEAEAMRRDPSFLLMVLGSDDAALRAAAADELEARLGEKTNFDPNAPAAQRDTALAALREQLAPTTRPADADDRDH